MKRTGNMDKRTARVVQRVVQTIFHTLIVLCLFVGPSILEGLIFGAAA